MTDHTPTTSGKAETLRYWRSGLTIYSSLDRGDHPSVEFHLAASSSTIQAANADEAITTLNSHATRITELEAEVKALREERISIRNAIPIPFLQGADVPGATGPTGKLNLVKAVRDLVFMARKWEARARSLIPESNNGGEE